MQQQVLTRWVFVGNVMMFVCLAAMLLAGFTAKPPAVMSVERLNIVDPAGHPVLVLSNGPRLPGGTFSHKEYPQSWVGRGRSAGMIFFNEVGDEVGGLIYEGASRDSAYRAFGQLSFDQWKQNQVVAVQYQDDGTSRSAGVRVWDRPTDIALEEQFALAERMLATPKGPERDALDRERLRVRAREEGTPRLFFGSENKAAKVELRDSDGRLRIRLFVDAAGAARLEFLDAAGRITAVYPQPAAGVGAK
jgi:hypothetical protein